VGRARFRWVWSAGQVAYRRFRLRVAIPELTREAVVKWYSETGTPRARGVAQAAELQKKLNGIMPQPSPGVAKWRHTFGNDWTGDPAIFFWVTLTDEASKKDNLSKATEAFRKVLCERIDFQNDWDLIPYFNFRSESEQAILNDEVYA
jgi:hypothetical protein